MKRHAATNHTDADAEHTPQPEQDLFALLADTDDLWASRRRLRRLGGLSALSEQLFPAPGPGPLRLQGAEADPGRRTG